VSGLARLGAALGAALLLACGCVRPPLHDPGTPVEDEALSRALRSALEGLYPAGFSAVHRVILTVRGRQQDMIGCVLVERSGGVRLVATGDMAGTIFELTRRADGSARVERNPAGLREAWLVGGAARDAAVMYLAGPSPRARLVRHESGALGLAEDLPDGRRREFCFSAAERRPAGYVESRAGRCLYRAEFSNYKLLAPWKEPVPGTVRIADYRLNYTAVIEVTGMRPQAVDAARLVPREPAGEK
jgi:hypothetical protein